MKTRFAPSPTGYLHLGNVRTALFCALLAQAQHGTFLLRIEDTDVARSTVHFADQLQEDLHWLGLGWQEGPYFQSQRQEVYAHYYERLIELGQVYPCFCSEQQLAIARKVQLAAGQPPRYPGTCRHLSSEQVAEKKAQGLQPTLRFAVPEAMNIEFTDFVRGPQNFLSNQIGDFIVRRADSTAPFFFCNAIDDAEMQVTHVLRGEDHLTNTPRQLLILQALQLPIPHYGHIALIVGTDNSPLSKRHGSRNIKELRTQGYLPAAIVNYLARLGHYYPNNELMEINELAAGFSLGALGKAPAHFDPAQLLYWQKQAVQQLALAEMLQWLGLTISEYVPTEKYPLFISAIQTNITFPEDALHWAKIFFGAELIYSTEALTILHQAGVAFFQAALTALEQEGADYKKIAHNIGQTLNIKGKSLFQPLRVALTGQIDGPEMIKIFELLGAEGVQRNLELTLQKL